jgi:hypothetical protein
MESMRDSGTDGAMSEKILSVGKIWRGDYPLWFSFWVLVVGAGFGMLCFWIYLGKAVLQAGSAPHSLSAMLGPALWLLIAGLLFGICSLYLLIAAIGAWRSAGRYTGWKIWRWLTWIALIFGMYQFAFLLFTLLDAILSSPATG